MGSPITLSGFNNIDFTLVLNAIMQQERVPVTRLQTQRQSLEAQKTAFGTLASRLAALESAAEALTRPAAFDGTSVLVSDDSRLRTSARGTAAAGTFEIVVQQLARAQVTTSAAGYGSPDEIVADGGTLEIGGSTISITAPVTLQGLADAINAADQVGVTASVVRGEAGYQLMLTGRRTGVSNAFAVNDHALTLSTGDVLRFSPTNAQDARDAQVTINNVLARSESNTFSGVIAGLDFTALEADPDAVVTVTITASSESVKALIEKVVAAFKHVVDFLDEQSAASAKGEGDNIGRDPLVRGLRRALASALGRSFGTGPYGSLALVGLEFTRTGELSFDAAAFDAAVSASPTEVRELFGGVDGRGGAFGTLVSAIAQYTEAGGFVPDAQNRVTAQVTSVSKRIAELEDRLELRRQALQREFIAADQAIAQLNASIGQLNALGDQFSLF